MNSKMDMLPLFISMFLYGALSMLTLHLRIMGAFSPPQTIVTVIVLLTITTITIIMEVGE